MLSQWESHQRQTTFGDLADTCVASVFHVRAAFCRTDVVCDRYCDTSIKSGTRRKRGKQTTPVRREIQNREVPRPPKWKNFNFITVLHCMQRGLSYEHLSVRPSVCLSVKRVNCDKTKAPSENSSIMTNRKSPTSFPMSLR